ncbi:CDC27 family protein [Nitrosophilus labii]|uniref:CDC27 family protein n=1 Tax=Nitrosophilus labii TaxID=2706014 RepID=UPI00165734EB|nr:CDC27 family protein [Nitrosophilus labii]
MYEIEELERKWKRYRLRKILKKITSFLLVASAASIVSLIFYNFSNIKKMALANLETDEKKEFKKEISQKVNVKSSEKIVLKKDENKTIKKNKEIKEIKEEPKVVVLKPSTNFLAKIENLEKKRQTKKIKKENKKVKREKIDEKPKKFKQNETPKKPKIVIEKRNNSNIVNELIKKFERTKDPKIAIFLSRIFYKDQDYKKALNWAIIANELDSQNAQSWILFAKASVKLGKKEEAIKALETFLSKNSSYKIKQILKEIKNGEFK